MSIAYRCGVLLLLLGLISCGGGGMSHNQGDPHVAQFTHVFIVVEENHSYNEVIGQSAMPYLNSLVSKYGLATNYFADLHPSLPNYFMLTTGQPITVDDSFTGVVTADNVVNALKAAGKTWKCYAESIPGTGYQGPDTNVYVKRHDPFAYFATVQNDSAQLANLVPFSQLSADIGANQLPNYGFIVPNLQNDSHDCPGGGQSCADSAKLAQADAWLAANIQPLIGNATFQQSGLLLIVFDESDGDFTNGGGQVPLLVISSKSKPGYKSTTFYQHQNTLRLMLQALGVSDLPGAANGATQMGEFFQ